MPGRTIVVMDSDNTSDNTNESTDVASSSASSSELYDKATFAFEAKRYTDAQAHLEELIALEPDRADVHLLLARSYFHSAQLGRAENALTSIVERWPDDAYAHFVLSRTLQRQGRAEEGRRHLLLAEAMGYEG